MRVPRRALMAYNDAIKRSGANAERAAKKALQVWLAENPSATVAETREFVKALVAEVGSAFGEVAGDAAYAMRDAVAEASGVKVTAYDYTYTPDADSINKAVRYQAKKLVEGNPSGFLDAVGEMARFYSERGANETMYAITEHDAARLGKRVRFARVPTGPTTCPWCLMLASRGFVYHSAETAGNGNRFHRNCDCRIVPGYGSNPSVEGYDPSDLYDQWRETGFTPKSGGGKTISISRKSEHAMPDADAHKLARQLLRGTAKLDRDEALERIAKAADEWGKTEHSVAEDNYFASRVNRLMVTWAITPREIADMQAWLLKNS